MTDYTLFAQGTPGADSGDPDDYTIGMLFKIDTPLYAVGCWFYKYATNTGTHQASLWDGDTQAKLTTVTFTGESASGWQFMAFPTNPLLDVAPAVYVVSVTMANGHYAATANYFNPDVTVGPITGMVGRFHENLPEAYPEANFGEPNYWVDIQLSDVVPGVTYVRPRIVTATGAAVQRAANW